MDADGDNNEGEDGGEDETRIRRWEQQQIPPHGELAVDRTKLATTLAHLHGLSYREAEQALWHSHN